MVELVILYLKEGFVCFTGVHHGEFGKHMILSNEFTNHIKTPSLYSPFLRLDKEDLRRNESCIDSGYLVTALAMTTLESRSS